MAEPEPPGTGIIESLRRLCASVLSLVQNRVELFAVEVQEQKVRLVRVLILAAVTVFLGNTALVVVTATIVVLAGDEARSAVLIGLSVFYLLAVAIAALALRRELHSAPPPFSDTVSELKKDCEWLKPRK